MKITNRDALISEGKAAELILDACRANEKRETKTLAGGNWRVSFQPNSDDTHEACLRGFGGAVWALAIVDKWDV